jgi:pSer/pThr/pTyr-binding forkhead associated (FHA) protein
MGRGDENDVVFADLRASRKHAELKKLANGRWHLRDLGSQNGVVWNGKVTREADLKSGDIVTVGETAFEFVPEEAGTQMMQSGPRALTADLLHGRAQSPAHPPAPLASIQPLAQLSPGAGLGASFPAIPGANSDFGGLQGIAGMGASTGSAGGGSEKRKKILYGIVGLMAVWLFLDDSETEKAAPKNPKQASADKKGEGAKKEPLRDLAQYLPPMANTSPLGAAETFFKEGFREFREKNYLRARVQFETALQINPAHSLSNAYLKQCDRAIDDDVKAHLSRGLREAESGKLKSARAHFEAVQRLLSRDTSHSAYKEATIKLKEIDERLKGAFSS